VSDEDVAARAEAISHLDANPPMALDTPKPQIPPLAEKAETDPYCWTHFAYHKDCITEGNRPKRVRRTPEQIAADKAAKEAERERKRAERLEAQAHARAERAVERVRAKEAAKAQKIADAEQGRVVLPAAVFRNGDVIHVTLPDAWGIIKLYLKHLFLDCENTGYPLGHKLYKLRTIQLGGKDCAIVLDASDPDQLAVAALALNMAEKLSAHSAGADAIPCVAAGLISWDDIWAKMHDSVLYLKLIDPTLSGSDASKLKEAAGEILGPKACSPQAEKDKNALFKAMGCLLETDNTTPPEKNGWLQVSHNAVVQARYDGSDVLDLALVMETLPPLPVEQSVLDRERWFEAKCARVAYDGFKLDYTHISMMIMEHEQLFKETQDTVRALSGGKIENPKSPEVIKVLKEQFPTTDFSIKDKTTKQYKDSAGKAVLERVKGQVKGKNPLLYHLSDQILQHRHHSTTLGLLLRPLENLCEYGDSRMRPTVYTINADTGRCSCVRPNGQQFSRQGGIRACVCADPGWVMCNADFQGCEIRVAAGLSGDNDLLEAEISPKCYRCDQNPCSCGQEHTGLHWMAAHAAFGYEATKEHRYWCKRGIFCRLFGGGPETAAQQVYCELEPMQRIFSAFQELAPTYTAWDEWLRKCFREGRMVWRDYESGENFSQEIEGRQRGIYRTYSGRNIYVKAPHAFGNYAIQGTARELLVDGVIRWSQTRWGHLPLLPIHDELLAWVPEADFGEATAALKRCMETSVLSSPGFPVHIGADPELTPYTYWPDSS